jgi:hypothetical protein
MLPLWFARNPAASAGRRVKAEYLYVDHAVFAMPGHLQRLPRTRGRRAIFVFFPDGHLDVVECGLEFNFDTKRLRAILTGAVVEHGTWDEPDSSTVAIHIPCSRFPAPPNAVPCVPPVTYRFGRFAPAGASRKVLDSGMRPGSSLVFAADLTNIEDLNRLLVREHLRGGKVRGKE